MKIENNGHFILKGIRNTDFEGNYSGQLSPSQINWLKKDIKEVPISSLNRAYNAPWTDTQTCYLKIQFTDSTYQTKVYGYYKEPTEIRIFIHHLMEIYRNTSLKLIPNDSLNIHINSYKQEFDKL